MSRRNEAIQAAINYANTLNWGDEDETMEDESEGKEEYYFMSVQRSTGDRSGSYAFHHQVCVGTESVSAVFKQMLDMADKQCGGSTHQNIQVLAFNKV